MASADILNRKALFLRACRGESVERVPAWIMRQAGRYLPEYLAVREKHSFLEICKTPDVAAEVSLQPFRRLDVDAVIVFSDILIVAEAMGMPLEVPDSGPILRNPIRDRAAVERLRMFDPGAATKFVGDAIRAICAAVGPDVPVIGFAAAPWTLACYMIEGQTRGDVNTAKRMMYAEPALLRALLEKIAEATGAYLRAQIAAGAAVVQLFDTWAGELSRGEYEEFELPATRRVIEEIHRTAAPAILFAKNSGHMLASLAATGADVLSLDWRVELDEARRVLGRGMGLQGNVDPRALLASPEIAAEAARDAIAKTGGIGHILNLGHGILPLTPVENAQAFIRAAHDFPLPAAVAPTQGEASRSAMW
jgi:uroporphyrinogen decarboxylase